MGSCCHTFALNIKRTKMKEKEEEEEEELYTMNRIAGMISTRKIRTTISCCRYHTQKSSEATLKNCP